MKLLGTELTFNNNEIWHKGNFDPASKVDKAEFDNLEIGGRNYICQFTNPKWKIHSNAEVIDSVTLKHSGTTGQGGINRSTLEIKLDEPGSYTLSGFIKGVPDLAIVLRPVGAGVQHTWYFNIEGDYEYITKSFRIQEPVIYTLELGGKDEPTEGLYFKKLKLEKGNKATDWTPAPEDIQAELDSKAPLASPAFTGTPTAPTAPNGTNTNQIATTKFVQNALSAGGYGDMLKATYDINNNGKVDIAEVAETVIGNEIQLGGRFKIVYNDIEDSLDVEVI